MTAWADSSLAGYDLDHEHLYLLTNLTQGDLPMKWTLRPSLAAASSKRTATFTDDDFRAWNKAWQDFYAGKGPKPAMPLARGTNSPDPDPSLTVIVNPPQTTITVPPPAGSNAAPTTIQVPVPYAVSVPAATPAAKPASGAKKASAAQKRAYRKCMKSANKKHGKTRGKARAKCSRMAH